MQEHILMAGRSQRNRKGLEMNGVILMAERKGRNNFIHFIH